MKGGKSFSILYCLFALALDEGLTMVGTVQ